MEAIRVLLGLGVLIVLLFMFFRAATGQLTLGPLDKKSKHRTVKYGQRAVSREKKLFSLAGRCFWKVASKPFKNIFR